VQAERLLFVPSADDAPPPDRATTVVVLDAAWTGAAGERPDIIGLRDLVGPGLRLHRPLAEALALVDQWAEQAGMSELVFAGGTTWWPRYRTSAWRWLHDRLVWRWALAELPGTATVLVVPAAEPALADVAGVLAGVVGAEIRTSVEPAPTPPPRPRVMARVRRRLGRALSSDRDRAFGGVPAERGRAAVARLELLADARAGRPLLVLSTPGAHQTVTVAGRTARLDPFLAQVASKLQDGPLDPVLLELGTNLVDDASWAAFNGPGRERTLPGSVLDGFTDLADAAKAGADAGRVAEDLKRVHVPLDLDGLDLGPALVARSAELAVRSLAHRLADADRIERFLRVLDPAGILCINEYSRPEWLAAAARAGVPVAAVQHGIIHAAHPGYMFPARAGLLLPARTYVFGDYERRLLTGTSVFEPGEVVVSGAPRLDLTSPAGITASERAAVRAELGVSPDDRLVVFSSTSSAEIRRLVVAPVLDAIFDRRLPRVHLAVKLHPVIDDGAFYRRLLDGLGRKVGRPIPSTIVNDIDLYRLLGAADAHLGIHSTVLTDAVAAGTLNLVASVFAESDLLDYVAAGVATAVADGADLVAALAAPPDPAYPAARAAFLADHFAPGAAGDRIAADLSRWLVR
jgi:hypothetical protein